MYKHGFHVLSTFYNALVFHSHQCFLPFGVGNVLKLHSSPLKPHLNVTLEDCDNLTRFICAPQIRGPDPRMAPRYNDSDRLYASVPR